MSSKNPPEVKAWQIANLLSEQKASLIRQWVARVRDDPAISAAKNLNDAELIDHLDVAVDRIIESVRHLKECCQSTDTGREQLEDNRRASDAGSEKIAGMSELTNTAAIRIRAGYAMPCTVRELVHLRQIILERFVGTGAILPNQSAALIHSAIDQIIIDLVEHITFQETEEKTRIDQLRERFIGILGHDLRSPLTTILATAEFIGMKARSGPVPRSDLTRHVQRITHAAHRMNRMIDDVLDFARSRLGSGIAIKRQYFDLTEVCRHILGDLRIASPDQPLEFQKTGDLHGCWDKDRLYQVISNLVANAMTYGPKGQLVKLSAHGEQADVQVAVTNQGKPIPPAERTRIFEPFKRGAQTVADPDRKGLGLGLYIVKSIVDAHQGHITITSDEGSGTTFTVRLPRHAIESTTPLAFPQAA